MRNCRCFEPSLAQHAKRDQTGAPVLQVDAQETAKTSMSLALTLLRTSGREYNIAEIKPLGGGGGARVSSGRCPRYRPVLN